MNRWARGLAGLLAAAVLLVACGSSTARTPPPPNSLIASAPASASTSASPAGGSKAPAASGPVECTGTISTPTTPYKAKLGRTYPDGAFDPSMVGGLAAGSITAQWWPGSNGTWIVEYLGLCNATAALCPGTSILVGTTFEDVSNSPSGVGGCAGDAKNLATSPAGLSFCNGGFYMYVTRIPNATKGDLYASVERSQPDGTIVGMTGTVPTRAGVGQLTPTIDLGKFSCKAVT